MLSFILTFGPDNGQSNLAISKAYTRSGTCTAYAPSTANRAVQLAPDVDALSFVTDQLTTCERLLVIVRKVRFTAKV